jgi:formylmethanofuran dehydrogenase subunit E
MRKEQNKDLLKELGNFRRVVEPGLAYGVKMIQKAREYLRIKDLRKANLLVISETTRCLPDAIQFLCGCTIGNKRLIIKDYGKMAATFIDRDKNLAVRVTISPKFQRQDVQRSKEFLRLKEKRRFEDIESRRLKDAFQILDTPEEELLRIQEVEIVEPLPAVFMPSGIIFCENCGESTREDKIQIRDGKKLCLVCAEVEKPYFKLKYGEEIL